jgi:hypothetical protein
VVKGGGTLIMENGAVFKNNNCADDVGGLSIEDGGIVIMNGGAIQDNTGSTGGISMSGGTLTMKGGTIDGNDGIVNGDSFGGGVRLNEGAQFNMDGGTISNNTTKGFGGGVNVTKGEFIMNKGTISNNRSEAHGGGVYLMTGTFAMYNGSISGNYAKGGGGGVYVRSIFTLNNGTISGNKVGKNAHGGGVYVEAGMFRMNLGSIIGNALNPMTPLPSSASWDEWKNIWKAEVGGTGKGAGVYVEKSGVFYKTNGSITGLFESTGGGQWTYNTSQNYYLWPIQNDGGSPGSLPPPYDNISKDIIGHRGFAVYYDAADNNNDINDYYCNEMVDAMHSLELKLNNNGTFAGDDGGLMKKVVP